MSSLVIINGVVYDIVSTSYSCVCQFCEFNIIDIACPRLKEDDGVPFPLLVCSWLDDIDDGCHYFIKKEVYL